jgi:hypothetical protein
LNIQAPLGWARVQTTNEAGRPYPSLAFDDSEVFASDALNNVPRWKESTLDQIVGRLARVEVEVGSGRLYAIRFAGEVVVGVDEQAGERTPNQNR